MYLTVLKMNKDSLLNNPELENQLEINSTYAIHQWITECQNRQRHEDNLLYRIMKRNDEVFLYIQSDMKFCTEGIEKKGLIYLRTIDLNDLFDSIDKDCVHFDVQVFPYKTLASTHKKVFLSDPEARLDWLKRQLERHGAKLYDKDTYMEYKLDNIVVDKKGYKRIFLPTSCFKGVLKIEDEKKFKEFVNHGFGRCKNFGLGLVLFR